MSKPRPSKTKFYKYMSEKHGRKYRDEEGYMLLIETMSKAAKDNESYMDLVELTLMNKTDRLIFRNNLAEQGKEYTPSQVNEYLSIIEYALEYTP